MGKPNVSRRKVVGQIGAAVGLAVTGDAVAGALRPTPRQIEGPFHPHDGQLDLDADLTRVEGQSGTAEGEAIIVGGRVTGVDEKPVRNALVNVWQCNHHGRYAHPDDLNPAPLDPNFQGWALIRANDEGRYRFKTVKPAPYPLDAFAPDLGYRCRHIHFNVSRDGYDELTTQMYFSGDPLTEDDVLLKNLPRELWPLLVIESAEDEETGLPYYEFNIVLGNATTV